MGKIKICILGNETPGDCDKWRQACEMIPDKVDYDLVDLCAWDWLEKIRSKQYDLFLTKPGGFTQSFKQLYDERLSILSGELQAKVFPTLKEVLIYENKRFFSFWLQANDIPHPKTWVFYNSKEVGEFLRSSDYPLVGKAAIGASGRGVHILPDHRAAHRYMTKVLSNRGLRSRWYPDLRKGRLISRIKRILGDKKYRTSKIGIYLSINRDPQRGFVILQEYIPHEFEWRVVRMGDSFFAHKKLKSGQKASGTLLKGYENPPLDILDFMKGITDRFGFYSQSVDIFESDRGYLVNEMQCFFGQSDPHQMLVDGVPGRYVYTDDRWVFEAGDFNSNESYDLRLETALDLYRRGLL